LIHFNAKMPIALDPKRDIMNAYICKNCDHEHQALKNPSPWKIGNILFRGLMGKD
jgi:hypothetical protein